MTAESLSPDVLEQYQSAMRESREFMERVKPVLPARVTREERTYEEHKTDSFFLDLVRSHVRGDLAARGRLFRHQHEVDVETRAARVDTNTGTGGEFAPPLWAIDKFTVPARAGRVLGDLVTNLVLPPGWEAVHTPKITTGADAAIDQEDGPVQSVDEVTADAQSTVRTIAGQADASLQLLDLTPPPGYDGIVYADLSSAYNQTLEKQMLAGTGTNGQLLGVTNVVGIGSVSGSSVSTSQDTMVQNLWTLIGQAAAIVGNNRLLPADVILLAPRRYYAIASAKDSSLRPLGTVGLTPAITAVPSAGGAHPVDRLIGINTYATGGIIGATPTTADYIVVTRPADMLLYESTPKFVVDPNPLSGTLQVRLQLRRYVAFICQKPSAIAVVTSIPQPTNF